jgi:hypothetical protein
MIDADKIEEIKEEVVHPFPVHFREFLNRDNENYLKEKEFANEK